MHSLKQSSVRLQVKFNWKIALCLFIIFLVLMRLGFWQLDRAEQKRQIQNDRDARRLATPVPIETLNLAQVNTLRNRKVILNGNYENTKSILISNQIFQGQPGYEVITMFKLHPSNQRILVSRGWISANVDRQLPAIEPVTGLQHLVAEIHIPASNAFFLPQKFKEPVVWPLNLHHFDISSINQLVDKPILPLVARLDQNNSGVLKRHWKVTRLQATNSTSYAIQWFGMALILVIVSFFKCTNILEVIRSRKSTSYIEE